MACAHTGRIGDEMTYPASIDNFTAKVDDVDDVMAQDVNEMQTAIKAIASREAPGRPVAREVALANRPNQVTDLIGRMELSSLP